MRLVMGDTQLVPFDMGTFGSRTTPVMNLQLRRVAAAARDALIEIAAKEWKADPAKLKATDGKVVDTAALDRYRFIRNTYLRARQAQIYEGRPPPEPEDEAQ